MLIHAVGITAATAAIIFATLLPFLPGPYDSLAVPVSWMVRVFGVVGLLLVPVGVLWLVSGYWKRMAGTQYGIALVALLACSIGWLMLSLAALASVGVVLGLACVAAGLYAMLRVFAHLRRLKSAPPRSVNPVAFYLVIVPVAVALLQAVVVGPAIEWSRKRAIRNSAPLIADIERYRAANGRYPASLLSVHDDHYKPGIIGIAGYQYEPSGDAYNLLFEQAALNFGTREFVVYNPRDQQAVTSHKVDLLEFSPAQLALEQRGGHYAVHDGPQPHWKYFWFD